MNAGFSSNSGIDTIITALVFLVAVSIALLIREYARAKVGSLVGDRVPRLAGRQNPSMQSIFDPVGSVFFPLFMAVTGGIGYSWAKPLSYEIGNPGQRRTVLFSALAGPAANVVTALLAIQVLAPLTQSLLAARFLGLFIAANLAMAVMHLLPIPPLDGSRIVAVFLTNPARASYQRIEPWGVAILFGIGLVGQWFRNQPFAAIIREVGNLLS